MSVNDIGPLALELPESLLDALAERVADRLAAQQRWVDIEGLAAYVGRPGDVRFARGLRERGLSAKRIGKRLIFDLRQVDEFLEQQ